MELLLVPSTTMMGGKCSTHAFISTITASGFRHSKWCDSLLTRYTIIMLVVFDSSACVTLPLR